MNPISRKLNNGRLSERSYNVLLYGSALVIAFVGLFPLYWMSQSAFTTRAALVSGLSPFPMGDAFTLDNFAVLTSGPVPQYIFNTAVITVGTIVVVDVVALIAGYGLARFKWRQKVNFARFLLFGYMFSPIVLGLPLFLIWRDLGLLNTYVGMIVALSAISMPFSVWLMWKYVQTIPEAQEETAWVAGASRFRTFRDIVIPQTRPALVATSLFAFAISWNDFTFAQILLPTQEKTTFAPGMLRLIRQGYEISFAEVMAVSLVMAIPPLLFAYFLQSYLLKGFQIRAL
jgi:multiple sugar transport system permease protein